jgi:HEPN domain-containing protein
MDNNEKMQYWLELADYDINAAKSMLNGKHYLYVGFLCHLSAEKALKAVT